MKYAMVGLGKMGTAVDRAATARGHRRTSVLARDTRLAPGDLGGARMAFEFTEPQAAEENVRRLLEAGVSVVCGTTGWSPDAELDRLAEQNGAGLLVAPNFSIGVQLFFRVVRHAAATFGALGLHDPFIEEAHHRGKIDAPSGTARRLAEIVREADGRIDAVCEGHPRGRLAPGTLQVVSTRAGAEPGTHRVGYDGEDDRIVLEHRARGREGFALGAVVAAEWLEAKRGFRELDEVLDAIARGELRVHQGGER